MKTVIFSGKITPTKLNFSSQQVHHPVSHIRSLWSITAGPAAQLIGDVLELHDNSGSACEITEASGGAAALQGIHLVALKRRNCLKNNQSRKGRATQHLNSLLNGP
ncbi:hypothetical protein NHX12_030980 [Muraenolepis orangiensis]|uniref:Uncharacterized protein n=1 Tax=Muraenolepis orangiensis TaxID=630683 RepID=A0A9Q0IMC9_9TELE|nr:hypothetical protein NHX12_030980 [Muraenolepis orangiensis]